MAVTAVEDPLLPSLLSIKKALDELNADPSDARRVEFERLVSECIKNFKHNAQYRNDVRFLKIWFLYMDCIGDFESVYREMEDSKICFNNAWLYETCALFLETKGKLVDALRVYKIGIARDAQPIERLKKAQSLFLDRMSLIVNACSIEKGHKSTTTTNPTPQGLPPMQGHVDQNKKLEDGSVNPWSASTINNLLQKINSQMLKYDGYHCTSKNFPGKANLSSHNSSRNKMIKIGSRDYLIKGCAGQGGFAKVFKAYLNGNPDEVVALKVQKPPFPWEFYMYRQLDTRISEKDRSSFGFAHWMHHYSDCSILVCDYLPSGTLQDAINSYVVVGGFMEEVLCIYYTIEMLRILETLHKANIIHGDFKPDNLLIRYGRDDLPDEKEDFRERCGPWHDQGLCLVDWGRGIDSNLFPYHVEFVGDCRTSGFRCVEMQENKPWKFQVDTYGLCVVVHMMLHSSYMEIVKKASPDGGSIYLPKTSFKRYWNVELWKKLFTRLLNPDPNVNHMDTLKQLRESFQGYMYSNPHLIKKLKHLLLKQKSSLCSS